MCLLRLREGLALATLVAAFSTAALPLLPPGELLAAAPGYLFHRTFGWPNFDGLFPVAGLREIEFRDDGVLFGTTGSPEPKLLRIAPESGSVAEVGLLPGEVLALEFVDGVLFGALESPPDARGLAASSRLVTIDPVTAQTTDVGPLGFIEVRGLARRPTTGVVFAVGHPLGEDPTLTYSSLFTVDLTSGAGTEIDVVYTERVAGLEFDLDGRLLGGLDSSNLEIGTLFQINPETGQVVDFGLSTLTDFEGLAVVPRQRNAIEVPTLGMGGLLLLAGVLGLAGLLVLRRRGVP